MFLVGITGGSGSGKTTFSNKLLSKVQNQRAILLRQDSYYLPSHPPYLRIRGESNFDHPESFDWVLLKEHLKKLQNGEAVQVPVYDFKMNRRLEQSVLLAPSPVVILEGLFVFWDPEIRSLLDLKIFLHVDADIRFIRRLHRDVLERTRTLENIIRQYYDIVRPMHRIYLEPTRQYADFVVGEEVDVAAEVVASKINQVFDFNPVKSFS